MEVGVVATVEIMPLLSSDVNRDLGPKAKDRGNKAKTFRYQGQGLGTSIPRPWPSSIKAKNLGLEVTRPRPSNMKAKDLGLGVTGLRPSGIKAKDLGLRSQGQPRTRDFKVSDKKRKRKLTDHKIYMHSD